jgi:hypothetical protein
VPSAMMAMISNGLHLVFFFAVDHFRRWLRKVNPVFLCLAIRSQQTSMEHVMDGPGRRELESISDWRNSLIDHKGTMTFGGKFGRSIGEIKVLRLQPDSVANLELVHGSLFNRSIERFLRLFPSPRCQLDSILRSLILGGRCRLEGSPWEVP